MIFKLCLNQQKTKAFEKKQKKYGKRQKLIPEMKSES
jgi:hypothetical protein